jgi:hypothetical protein
LGHRVYEVIFDARMNILFALYPHHKETTQCKLFGTRRERMNASKPS